MIHYDNLLEIKTLDLDLNNHCNYVSPLLV